MVSKKMIAVLSGVIGAVIVAACGGQGAAGSGNGGNGGAGAGNPSSGASMQSNFTCCINDAHYRCPDHASFIKCSGFDIDACMQGCTPGDFNCMDSCFDQWSSATNDPSDCDEDASVQCNTGTTTGSGGSNPGLCVGDWDGTSCDYDADCTSDNCYKNKCYGNANGNPCEYDADCTSDNCYQNCCYGNSAGNPCEYDADCDSDNCFNNKCQ